MHKSARESSIERTIVQETEVEAWKHLRAGLRLKDIVSSKRMNEIGLDIKSAEKKKLVI